MGEINKKIKLNNAKDFFCCRCNDGTKAVVFTALSLGKEALPMCEIHAKEFQDKLNKKLKK